MNQCESTARFIARKYPGADWRDLVQEAELGRLMGRTSERGPMECYVQREYMVHHGNWRERVPRLLLDSIVNLQVNPWKVIEAHIIVFQLLRRTLLPERHRKILIAQYWRGESRKKIAGTRRLSESRIDQLHAEAISKLRAAAVE